MKHLILATGLLCGMAHAAGAAVFEEDFDAEAGGGVSILNYNSFAQFSADDGTVDLITSGTYSITCAGGGGSCVDLDGSTSDAAFFYSSALALTAGTSYMLSFDVSGNQRGGSDMMTYGIYDSILDPVAGLTSTVSKVASDAFETIMLSFSVGTSGSYSIGFENAGGDNIGMILDNVLLEDMSTPSEIPLPATLPLLLAGLGTLGLRRRR